MLRIYHPAYFRQSFSQDFHHFFDLDGVGPGVRDIGAIVPRVGASSAMQPEDRFGAPIGLGPGSEPGFKLWAHCDDQRRPTQVFRVAGAELEPMRLAPSRNDAYRFKPFTTNDLNPFFNDAETRHNDRFFLRIGLSAEPESRGDDQGCKETKHVNPDSQGPAPDARSLHLTNVPNLLVFAFA